MFGLTRDLQNPLAAPVPGGTPTQAPTWTSTGWSVGARGTMSRKLGARRDGAQAHRRRGSAAHAGRPRELGPGWRRPDRRGAPRPAREGDRARPVRPAPVEPPGAACCSARAPGTTGCDSVWPTTSWPTETTAANAPCRPRAATSAASWAFGDHFVPYVECLDRVRDPDDNRAGEPTRRLRRIQPGPRAAARGELRDRRAGPAAAQPDVIRSRLFLGRITDAIVQQQEVGGRAFFRNEGKTHNDGAEIGVTYSPIEATHAAGCVHPGTAIASWAETSTATVCRGCPIISGASAFGHRCRRVSSSMRTRRSASSVPADDANTIIIDSWDAGVTNLRLGWEGSTGSAAARTVRRA